MPQFIHQLHSLFLSFYFLLVLQAPPPKLVIPELAQMYSGPRGFSWNFSSRKRAQLAKRWQLAIAASQLAVSLAKKNFKKILWDQGSTNEPARRLGGLWRLRDFLYSHCSDTLIFFHGMQFLLSSTCMLFSRAHFRPRYGSQRTVSFKCPPIELQRRDWYNEGHKCWDTSVKSPLFT